tara:strand:- start:3097 stop:3411 length:315 start_codon:yes stop_codon:yes gene_type:complete
MPNFPKNTDYKMKGSTFYGYGNSSPAKVSDTAVVEAQAALNKTELDFREPGWAKAARGIHEGAKGVVNKFMDKDKKEDGQEPEGQTKSVESIAEKNIDLEGDLD